MFLFDIINLIKGDIRMQSVQPIIIASNSCCSQPKKNGRNTFPAICSALVPGLGQAMNGENDKAVLHAGSIFGLSIISSYALNKIKELPKNFKIMTTKDFKKEINLANALKEDIVKDIKIPNAKTARAKIKFILKKAKSGFKDTNIKGIKDALVELQGVKEIKYGLRKTFRTSIKNKALPVILIASAFTAGVIKVASFIDAYRSNKEA